MCNMELNQLKYFLEVAKHQHVTKSAEKLHIAQPALTKSIHRLEDELGVPLFCANGRNIILTEYGKFLQDKLSPIMAQLDAVPKQLQAMAQLENETIHLNVLAASTVVTNAIILYQKQHGNLHFQLMQNSESKLYDIGITTRMPNHAASDNRQSEFVFNEQIYLAVKQSHPLAIKSEISLIEAADEGFISLMGSRQFRWICDRFCSHAGFTPNIIFESDNPAAVKNMIAANMGVGFWPEFTWGELNNDDIKLLKITEPLCRRDIVFDCNHNKSDNSAVTDFFGFLRDYCASVQSKSAKHQ